MRIKDGFVIERVADSYFAVAVGETASEYNAILKMNESGAFLWNLLASSDRTPRELLSLMLEEYEIDAESAKRDIASFLDKLKSEGLLID